MNEEEKKIEEEEKQAISDFIRDAVKQAVVEANQQIETESITKESILAIKDRHERQRMIEEHLELFS